MKIYITLKNIFYILAELDSDQQKLAEEFIQFFYKKPEWLDFANFWINQVNGRYGKDARGRNHFGLIPQLPVFTIGQDLESRLGIEQGMVRKTFEGPEDFLYDDIDDVIVYYRGLLEKDTDNPRLCHSLGHLLTSKPDPSYKEAIGYFQKAVRKFPAYRQANFDLGMAYLCIKDIENAEKQVGMLERIGSRKYAEMLREELQKAIGA